MNYIVREVEMNCELNWKEQAVKLETFYSANVCGKWV